MRALVSWMLGRVRRARERSSRRGLGVDGAMEWGLVAVGGEGRLSCLSRCGCGWLWGEEAQRVGLGLMAVVVI